METPTATFLWRDKSGRSSSTRLARVSRMGVKPAGSSTSRQPRVTRRLRSIGW
ncbi:MAG: hypothetical protein M5U28_36550 [Sandaracinaceae bacterium]|nr:hypothetical protein [Sandaracinaceae bacterium]